MAEPNEPPHSTEPPEDFFLRHLDLIEKIAKSVAKRKKIPSSEVEELVSFVKVKLLEDDYRRIRSYRGLCPPKPFLAVTIGRLGFDFLDTIWQRWHHCAEAKRMGPAAILLNQLINRDGRTFDEACEELRTKHGVTASREELERIHSALPRRVPRRQVGEESLQNAPAKEPSPEEAAIARENAAQEKSVAKVLGKVSKGLPTDDRILLRLLFRDGHSIADIARVQKTDQKSLYRRRDKILRFLRDELRKNGWGEDEVAPLF